tara:strand:+ start:689 stop:835 length:147 start_codon:yes stop_codon:yes gene_type:complete
MEQPNLPYKVIKEALIADANYWRTISTPFDDEEELIEMDDYPEGEEEW